MFEKRTRGRITILDGAIGTNLLSAGLKAGESPCILNLRNPEAVLGIQRAYVDAGSNIIMTNTFSANPLNIAARQLTRVIERGIAIARRASRGKARIWADVGPLGELIEPYGPLKLTEARKTYQSIFKVFCWNGIKDFFIETFTSIAEAKAAFLSARPYARSIAVSLSLQENIRTLMGETPESIAVTFDALGASAIGINCTEPEVVVRALSCMHPYSTRPLIAKPNAGRVTIKNNKLHNSLNDKQLAGYYVEFVKAGASMIGGCCGTTPEYISLISRKRSGPKAKPVTTENFICSGRKVVGLGKEGIKIVGERLNPSGRSQLRSALQRGDYSCYNIDARRQEQAGADILDVNAYVAECDEEKSIVKAVNEVCRASTLPIMLDCQNLDAAIAVMERYPGIGVLNSVAAREKDLKKWLPAIKKCGFKVVISLIGRKIPRTVAERVQNARTALKIAGRLGFRRDDMIFDPLVFTLASEPGQVTVTLKAVRALRRRNLTTVLGVSNVSYGLPCRSAINASFVANAIQAGVNLIIMNPLDTRMMETVKASRVLFHGGMQGYLTWARDYEGKIALAKPLVKHGGSAKGGEKSELGNAIVSGNTEKIIALTNQLLGCGIKPQTIIDKHVTAALHIVGDQYERGRMFIPDLLRSAEAAKISLNAIKAHLPRKHAEGTILLATVEGDIHDIGKNIAGMVFESAGYRVIDLGKDVPAKRILESIRKYRPDVLGLSALLTTTMPEMENVVKQIRKNRLSVKVIIGGPNVSAAYAKKIGAYGAARNVLDGLRILKSMA